MKTGMNVIELLLSLPNPKSNKGFVQSKIQTKGCQ